MAKRNRNIKWVNRWSHEEGFVRTIHKAEGYFENTFEQESARKYSESEAATAVSTLNEIGEGESNEFYIVETA